MFYKKIVVLALLLLTVDAKGIEFSFIQMLLDHWLMKLEFFLSLFGYNDYQESDKLTVQSTKSDANVKVSPDINKSFQQIVAENGFIFESHPVTTEDGYILNVFRITSEETKKGAPVVFLQHGITDSADCWVMHYPNVAPAFQLVNAGYDVWLGNQRGTKHSPGHKTLTQKDKEYWEFSFTEMGTYDAPAQVDYIRKKTGVDKVTYIGHSQGTTQMFWGLADQDKAWSERINAFIALAPVTRLTNTKSQLFKFVAPLSNGFRDALYLVHVYSILGDLSNAATKETCKLFPSFCQFAESFLITQDPSLDDVDRFQVYMGHFPAGASVQSIVHYGQTISHDDMLLYDWGSKDVNQQKYGQDTPPHIDLKKIKSVPIAMFVGTADDLGDVKDAEWARDQLNSNVMALYQEVDAGHSTFMIGKDMSYFDKVMDFVKQHNPMTTQEEL